LSPFRVEAVARAAVERSDPQWRHRAARLRAETAAAARGRM